MAGKTVTASMHAQCGPGCGQHFYAYMFDHYPETRKYFKGYENKTGVDVEKSDFFKKQGEKLCLAIKVLAALHEDTPTFKAYADEIVDRHMRKDVYLDPKLWSEFWQMFLAYLSSKGPVDAATTKAFQQLGEDFSTECLNHLKTVGK